MTVAEDRGNRILVAVNCVLPVFAVVYLIWLNRTSSSAFKYSDVVPFVVLGYLPMTIIPLVFSWIALMRGKIFYFIPCTVIVVCFVVLMIGFEK